MERYEEILDFWFEGIDEDSEVAPDSNLVKKWFIVSEKFDTEVRKNFETDLKKAQNGEYKNWEDDPRGRLALIILFDQFSRQIHRGLEKAFVSDIAALELSLRSIKDGFDGRVNFVERIFYYMPIMHTESKEVQVTSVEIFEKHLREAERYEDQNIQLFQLNLEHAVKHRDVIFQFNRFPFRNDAMGRRSTSDEREFMEDPAN